MPPSFSFTNSSTSTTPSTTTYNLLAPSIIDGDQMDGDRAFWTLASPAVDVVQEDATSSVDDVCYGMIDQIKCRQILQRASTDHVAGIETTSSVSFVELRLERHQDRYDLFLPRNDEPFAHVNCKAALVFTEVERQTSTSFKAYLSCTELHEFLRGSNSKAGKASTLFVKLNVYGPVDRAAQVGRLFSAHSMFLQDPFWMDYGVIYTNPHVIKFEGLSDDEIWLKSLELQCDKAARKEDWHVVLDDLPQHQAASGPYGDLLLVQLLSHQKDGIDYMLRRESGRLADMFRFWRLDRTENGLPIYRHVVTGAERHDCPLEPTGGILADDMGLGKTLTTISVIANSLDRAKSFVAGKRDHCRAGAPKSRTKTTLVVVPSILILEDWAKEIECRVKPGTLRVTKYHGHERAKHFSELLDFDVVLTTYGTITTEHRKMKSREVLYHLHWFRIVLDEAHFIRSQNTKQFQAIISLTSVHHWCLSGTIISNKVEDLGALVRFCKVPLLEEPAAFREHVTNTAKRSFGQGCRVLRQTLSPLCLRRTKALLNLPKSTTIYCAIKFSAAERRQYNQVQDYFKRAIDSVVSGKSLSNKRHTVLHAILQLRRQCNHGTILRPTVETTDETLDADEVLTLLQEKDAAFCVECSCEITLINQSQDATSAVIGICGHGLCISCLGSSSQTPPTAEFHCPTCEKIVQRMTMTIDTHSQRQTLPSPFSTAHSTKLNKLIENLSDTKDQEKSLVFSVWKTTINVASDMCASRGLIHVRIDGTTPQPQRRQAIHRFKNDPEVSVMLMTVGTGALGLNLTAASRIHIIEPQWNLFVEEQAIGRVVRIGQENKTTVIRYIVENTVEVAIQGYQKRKIQLAAGGFGESAEAETEAQTRLLTASFLNQTA